VVRIGAALVSPDVVVVHRQIGAQHQPWIYEIK
jgi:hypothetical protein